VVKSIAFVFSKVCGTFTRKRDRGVVMRLQDILCRIGLHNWEEVGTEGGINSLGLRGDTYDKYECSNCGKKTVTVRARF
jgi:hypothetical protein